jgi:hypothetical protein
MEFLFLICTDATAPEYQPAEDNIEEWVGEVERRASGRPATGFDSPPTPRQ